MSAGVPVLPATDIVLPGAVSLSEFGQFTGDCVEAATEIFSAAVQGRAPSTTNLNDMVRRWQTLGQAGTRGQSNWIAASDELSRQGIDHTTYGPGDMGDWRSVLRQDAGQRPILLGISNADALGGWDSGVHGHAITIVGTYPGGYVVADPNSPEAASGQFVHYSEAQLAAAEPSSMIVGPTMAQNGSTSGLPLWLQAALGITQGATQQATQQVAGMTLRNTVLDGLIRAALIGAGAILVLVALALFFRPQIEQAATTAGRVAAVAA